jgi:exopolyphosphatase/guanosine-5'-triphosphate,3'-diphosphate pyrophosphatase
VAKAMAKPASARGEAPDRAVIDIGSNSVRLVVYSGPARLPRPILDEKVMAGLGRGLVRDGRLDEASIAAALAALRRYAAILAMLGVSEVQTVATAAVREATNGPDFLDQVRALGLKPRLLSGEEEAIASAYGVVSAFPREEGIVGDLGGGSLELVEISRGAVRHADSFPLGALRVPAIRAEGPKVLDRYLRKALGKKGWLGAGTKRPFFLVGGSWRALALLDMDRSNHPLRLAHGYEMAPTEAGKLSRIIAHLDPRRLREVPGISDARAPQLGDAAALLAALVRQMGPSKLVTSSFGLREGLLFQKLSTDERAEDPLLVGAREFQRVQGRRAGFAEALNGWMEPLFAGQRGKRLRLAACLIAGESAVSGRGIRAARGLDMALNFEWIGISARGRAMLAQAVFTSLGGKGLPEPLAKLCSAADLARAQQWGLAIRFGAKFSGSALVPLERSTLKLEAGKLILSIHPSLASLYTDPPRRSHRALAAAVGIEAKVQQVDEG